LSREILGQIAADSYEVRTWVAVRTDVGGAKRIAEEIVPARLDAVRVARSLAEWRPKAGVSDSQRGLL